MDNKGTCKLCKQEIIQKEKNKHLKSCIIKNYESLNGKENFFLISIEGQYSPEYWLNILFNSEWTLKKLDKFLRDIWLECCGHMSAFEINKTRYSVHPDREYNEKGMGISISDVVTVGNSFTHIYDYGSSTELKLKIVSEIQTDKEIKKPEILAQNDMPQIKCDNCHEKIATNICCECIYDDNGWLCDDCVKKHECGEDMLLPVVNSPRVGVCGYCG